MTVVREMTSAGPLKHHLSLVGYSLKPTIVNLTPDTEFRFAELMMRFIKEMETDSKIKKLPARMGICEYIAKTAGTVIGGKKEKVEEELSRMISTMDFTSQSDQVSLYSWILSHNFSLRLLSLHNKVLSRLRTFDADLMLSRQKGLSKVFHIFKDVVDIAGKFLDKKGVEIFVEKIEQADGHRKGGFRDRKVAAVLTLYAALMAGHETRYGEPPSTHQESRGGAYREGSVNRDFERRNSNGTIAFTAAGTTHSKDKAHAEATRQRQLEYEQVEHKFTLKKRQRSRDSGGNDSADEEASRERRFDLNEIRLAKDTAAEIDTYISAKNRAASLEKRDRSKSRPAEDLDQDPDAKDKQRKEGTKKVAHKYFFSNTEETNEIKKDTKKLVKGTKEEQMQELEERYTAAKNKNDHLDTIYLMLLDHFKEAKKNYITMGKEITSCTKMAKFIKETFPKEKEAVKLCDEVQGQDAPNTKKTKLVIGKVLEKASKEILAEDKQVYKFALDKDDYDNQAAVLRSDNMRDAAYELVEKEPTDTSKGARNAKNVIRENHEVMAGSPLRGQSKTANKGPEDDQDDEETVLIKRSAFYDPRQQLKKSNSRTATEAYEKEIGGFKLDERILHGMGLLVVKKFLPETLTQSKKGSGKKREDSLSSSKTSLDEVHNQDLDKLLKATIGLHKKYNLTDFEKGLGPNYIEFEEERSDSKEAKKAPVFDRERSKQTEAELLSSPRKPTQGRNVKVRIGGQQGASSLRSKSPQRPNLPTNTNSKDAAHQSRHSGSKEGKGYKLYQDPDPAFGVYTNVKLDRPLVYNNGLNQPSARKVGRFNPH